MEDFATGTDSGLITPLLSGRDSTRLNFGRQGGLRFLYQMAFPGANLSRQLARRRNLTTSARLSDNGG